MRDRLKEGTQGLRAIRFRRGCLGLLLALCSAAASATPPTSLPPLRDAKPGLSVPGKFVWADLYSSDPDRAAAFYSRLFGWDAKSYGSGVDTYIVLSNGDGPLAGIVQRSMKDPADNDSRWVHYVAVPDIAKAAKAVEAQGGSVVLRPKEVAGRGKQALVADKAVAVFGLLQAANGDPEDFRAEPGEWVWMQLFTPDPAVSSGFYQQVLGYTVQLDPRFDKTNVYQLVSADAARGAIAPLPSGSEGRSVWVGFVRVDDVAQAVYRAQQLGATVLVQPTDVNQVSGQLALLRDPVGGVFGVLRIDFDDGAQP